MKRTGMYLTALAVPLLFAGCAQEREAVQPTVEPPEERVEAPEQQAEMMHREAESAEDVSEAIAAASEAQATLQSAEGQNIEGTVYLLQEEDSVVLMGTIRGLEPGVHAIHIHETGDCSAPDFSSAGDHFNPTDAPHGGPFETEKHLGDLGNLITNDRGIADFSIRIMDAETATEGEQSYMNRAIIIHQDADDYETQPSGNAGARIACGVIEPSERQEGEEVSS